MYLQPSPVTVSVIVPVYNAAAYVLAAINSILPNYPWLEVIAVNDGSTDHSLELLRSIQDPRLKLVDNQGKGIAAGINTGLALATGEMIVRCDADDLYPAQRLSSQVEWLLNNPDYGAVCGSFVMVNPRGQVVSRLNCGDQAMEITAELQRGMVRTHLCTYAIRREVLTTVGGCRPYFVTAEDVDLQLRIGETCRVWYQPQVNYLYRIHDRSITHQKSVTERDYFEAVARKFQRQRQTTGQDDLQRGCPPPTPSRPKSATCLNAAAHIQGLLLGWAWDEHRAGRRAQAFWLGSRAALTNPTNLTIWRSLAALALKSPS